MHDYTQYRTILSILPQTVAIFSMDWVCPSSSLQLRGVETRPGYHTVQGLEPSGFFLLCPPRLCTRLPAPLVREMALTRMSVSSESLPEARREQLRSLNAQYSLAVTKKFQGSRLPIPRQKKMM